MELNTKPFCIEFIYVFSENWKKNEEDEGEPALLKLQKAF
jgi:hypothetical protein